MRWRLLKLNWSYAIGELVIVVLGVVIALAFDQWNSDRLERIEEAAIVERLLADLEVDVKTNAGALERLSRKGEHVRSAISTLKGAPPKNRAEMEAFLKDLDESAVYGWYQLRARRTTFEDVLASGKFELIRDPNIRAKVADYYEQDAVNTVRIDERETVYPDLMIGLVPENSDGGALANLSDEQLAAIVTEVYAVLSPRHLFAEGNFAIFVEQRYQDWSDSLSELIATLDAYRGSLN